MLRTIAFMGGAICGAAGLLGLAMHDAHKNGGRPLPDNFSTLSAEECERLLESYFINAQKIYADCNELALESCGLISTPIELPDDSVFQKGANFIGGSATLIARALRIRQLNGLLADAIELYAKYRPVFVRSNELLRERGQKALALSDLAPQKNAICANNDLENDDWGFELENGADVIRDFIELSCGRAEALIDLLGAAPVCLPSVNASQT